MNGVIPTPSFHLLRSSRGSYLFGLTVKSKYIRSKETQTAIYYLDAGGNVITQEVNSVTDAAGNPATGIVIHKKIEVDFFWRVWGVPPPKKIA